MSDHGLDPAVKLLLGAPVEPGRRALVLFAGVGELAAGFAARFSEVICHNAYYPQHAAALRHVEAKGLPQVRCLLGDVPSAGPETGPTPEAGVETGAEPDEEDGSDIRFPSGHFDLVVFRLARGTAQVNAALMEAFRLLRRGGCLLACGHNQEGIKSFAKRAEDHFGNAHLLGFKSSCRLLRFRKDSDEPVQAVEDPRYFQSVPLEVELPGSGRIGYLTKPGIFAYRSTDPGTVLLARHLPDCAGKDVLDLGCGSGVLSLAACKLGARSVLAIDSSAIAVACARRNFARAAVPARTQCTDLTQGVEGQFDIILSNPPFHKDGDTDYSLPGRILDALLLHVRSEGQVLLVANQFLDYAGLGRKRFKSVETIARDQGYAVFRMIKG